MESITWSDFEKLEMRVGRIIEAAEFPEARKPAYKLKVDFGEEIGIKRSTAQITHHYSLQELTGKLVMGVVNFPPKQVGPTISECLITGFYDTDGHVVLAVPDKEITVGARLG